jgi:hypothetical protein
VSWRRSPSNEWGVGIASGVRVASVLSENEVPHMAQKRASGAAGALHAAHSLSTCAPQYPQ